MSSKQELKLKLLKITPNCPLCGCKMTAVNPNNKKGNISHACVLINDNTALICYGCKRNQDKKKDFQKLSWKTRMVKKIDEFTGFFTMLKTTRGSINKFIYTKIRGNKLKSP